MKIKIENGKPSVEFLRSEEKAFRTTREKCAELAEWLIDDDAKGAEIVLDTLINRYMPPKEGASQEVK